MNLPPNPPSDLAALIRRLASQLAAAGADPAGFDPALVTASALEQCSLDAGQPLLAGAAICVQQRLELFASGREGPEGLALLAEAWTAHGPNLLAPAGDPALETAWTALQAHLTSPIPEDSGQPEFAPPGQEPIQAGDAPVDAGAFLDSLDAPSDPAPAVGFPPPPSSSAAPEEVPLPELAPAAPPAPPEAAAEELVPPEILEAFAQESREAFETMEQSIMAWEKNPVHANELRNVFRLAHSVKGAANSVGLRAVGAVLHRLEDMLEDLVEGRGRIVPGALAALVLGVIDALRSALASGESNLPEWGATSELLIGRIHALRATLDDSAAAEAPVPALAAEAPGAAIAASPAIVPAAAPVGEAPEAVAAAPAGDMRSTLETPAASPAAPAAVADRTPVAAKAAASGAPDVRN
ncbi:MAG: Hpt domain-containing protein, partial [Verrucomicrobia bacterium]|nr:Hpt domain-containing protein [Verrucomicrobiota bacterium]